MFNFHENSLFMSYKYPILQHLPPCFCFFSAADVRNPTVGWFLVRWLRMLIFGRLIAGVGVGITSAAGPAFISDTGLVEGMEMG